MILEKQIILDNVMLKTSPRLKKFSLQFLPESLLEISKNKNFTYKCQKLKSAYLVDIVHNLLLKYYFKKENSFTLSSLILKDKYGYLYNYYIDYLKDNNIIRMEKNYLKGSSSRIYSLNVDVINSNILRYQNSDKVLLKKYLTKHLQYELDRNDLIKKSIKKRLISDLYSVKIEFERSIFYLDSLKMDDVDIYNRNKYSVEAINQKHIFYHFDSYGRMHTNFTILKSFIRKNCLMIDGEETCELDIKNSQPLFLSKLIKECNLDMVNSDEFKIFSTLVKNGNYYQYLIDNLKLKGKEEAKNLTYKVLFGQNRINSKPDKLFSILPLSKERKDNAKAPNSFENNTFAAGTILTEEVTSQWRSMFTSSEKALQFIDEYIPGATPASRIRNFALLLWVPKTWYKDTLWKEVDKWSRGNARICPPNEINDKWVAIGYSDSNWTIYQEDKTYSMPIISFQDKLPN